MNLNCPECGSELEISSLYGAPPPTLECRSCGASLSWSDSAGAYTKKGKDKPVLEPTAVEGISGVDVAASETVDVPDPPGGSKTKSPRAVSMVHPESLKGPEKARTIPDRSRENLMGRIIGGCEIQAFIGKGGMGTVYKARQISLDRTVAFKVVSEKAVRDESFLRRFEREAKTIAKFNSSRIVQIFEVGFEHGVHYITMEYVPGGDLKAKTRKQGRIPPADALGYIQQAAEGLLAAEKQKIVHRDLKPENLMLDANGEIKITDFGLAKTLQTDFTLTQMGDYLGTPIYMSPEQAQGSQLDHRSDMYSLGATFFYLLTGTTPITGDSIYEILRRKAERQYLDPRDTLEKKAVPESICNIIRRMTALKIDDRYPSFQDLIVEIDGLREGRRTRAYRPGLRVWLKRLVLVAVLLVLILVVGSRFNEIKDALFGSSFTPKPEIPKVVQDEDVKRIELRTEDLKKKYGEGRFTMGLLDEAEKLRADIQGSLARGVRVQKYLTEVNTISGGIAEGMVSDCEKEIRKIQGVKEVGLGLLENTLDLHEKIDALPLIREDLKKRIDQGLKTLQDLINGGARRLVGSYQTRLEDLLGQMKGGPGIALQEDAKNLQVELQEKAAPLLVRIQKALDDGSDLKGQLDQLSTRLAGLVRDIEAARGIQDRLSRTQEIRVAMPFEDLPVQVKDLRNLLAPGESAGPELKEWLENEKGKRLEKAQGRAGEELKNYFDATRGGEKDLLSRLDALRKAKRTLAQAFPGSQDRWEGLVPESQLLRLEKGMEKERLRNEKIAGLKRFLAAIDGRFPKPDRAGDWNPELEQKIGSEIKEGREKSASLSGEGGQAGLEGVEKQINDLESQLTLWRNHSRNFEQALASFRSHRLGDVQAKLEEFKQSGLKDSRVGKLSSAREAMESGFRSLLENLNLEKAKASFEEARDLCRGTSLESAADYPEKCLKRLSELKALTAGMAPVKSGTVKLPEESSQRNVAGFFIDQCETSVKEFRAFLQDPVRVKSLDARYRRMPSYVDARTPDDWPIEEVNYYQALACVRSLGKDLFTLAEWWLAAKGRLEDGPHREFPCHPSDINDTGRPKPVDQGGECVNFQFPYAVHHLSGNVAEWVRADEGARRSQLLGGSYDSTKRYFSGEGRINMDLNDTRRGYGFRGVVRPGDFFESLKPK